MFSYMQHEMKEEYLPFVKILTYAWRIYVKKIKYIAAVVVAVYLPMLIIRYLKPEDLILPYIMPKLMQSLAGLFPTAYIEDYAIKVSLMLVSTVLYIIFAPLALSAIGIIVKDTIEGSLIQAEKLFDATIHVWHKHLFTAAIYLACIFLGAMLFIIPCFYFYGAYYFSPLSTALTGRWGFSALSATKNIMTKKIAKTVGFLALLNVLATLLVMFFSVIVITLDNIVASFVIDFALLFVSAFTTLASTLWYFNVMYKKAQASNKL